MTDTKLNILAIIPVRGGSKGVPRKNIKPFCGKPLLAWAIDEARKSRFITRIIVSTDDDEIAAVARSCGLEVPFMRPSEFAQDSTPDLPVFEHALNWLKTHEGYEPDLVVHLRANSPLRVVEDIDEGIELAIERPDADCVRAVAKAPLHPLKAYRLDEDGTLGPFVPEDVFGIECPFDRPWQSLPKAFTTGGYLSVLRPNTILEKRTMSGDKMLGYEVDSSHVLDIDTPMQFAVAEYLMKQRLDPSH